MQITIELLEHEIRVLRNNLKAEKAQQEYNYEEVIKQAKMYQLKIESLESIISDGKAENERLHSELTKARAINIELKNRFNSIEYSETNAFSYSPLRATNPVISKE